LGHEVSGWLALMRSLLHSGPDDAAKGRIHCDAIRNENNMDTPLTDAAAAAAFRRLVSHLQHRHDAQNIDLMGLAGFCRNCLADWVMDAVNEQGGGLTKDQARELIHGMPANEWKARFQSEATPEQLQRMKESVAKNAGGH
jgi:uncharacterized protein